jgi:ABC-type uncharacterized transport system involved in gliding motility auxiliary subunit
MTTPAPAPRKSPVPLSILTSLVLLAALVVGNLVLARFAVRADLTEDRLYSLSDATRRVLGKLSDPCRIVVYWGEKVPGTVQPVRRRLRGLLEEYVAAGDGKVIVQWPTMDDNGTKDADEKGIPEAEFGVWEANERSIVKAHAGLAILYEDKAETIPMLVELQDDNRGFTLNTDLEYQLTSRIHKLARTSTALVGLVTETTAPRFDFQNPRGAPTDNFGGLAQLLDEVYGNGLRRSVDLEQPVAADLSVLVVLAPKEWNEKKAFHLEQFLLRGGKVLLLANPVDAEVVFGRGETKKSGLEDWLKSFGVEIAPGVLADYAPEGQCAAVVGRGEIRRYPYWIRLQAEHLDRGNPGLKGLGGVPMYFASEVVVDAKAQEAAGRTLSTLGSTSPSGYRRTELAGLEQFDGPEGKALGSHVVMVALQGKFTSYWKGKPSPAEPPPPAAPVVPEPPAMTDAPPAPPPAETPAMTETPPAPPPAETPAMTEAPPAPPAMAGDGAKGPEGEAGAEPKKDAPPARLDEGSGLLVVLGDADLVSDQFAGGRRDLTNGATAYINGIGGFSLVPNLIGWLSGGDELLTLRARGSTVRKLEEIPKEKAGQLQWVNILGLPVLVLVLGLVVYFVRKHRS